MTSKGRWGWAERHLGLRYLDHGIVVSALGAWGWWQVTTVPYDLLTDAQREQLANGATAALAGLRNATCHLLVVPKPHSVEDWARRLDETVSAPSAVWPSYLSGQAEHVRGMGMTERLVFIGIELESTKTAKGLARTLQVMETAAGVQGPPVSPGDVERWTTKAETLGLHLAASELRAVAAPAEQLRWLVRRPFWRALAAPPARLRSGPCWGGELVALTGGTVRNGPRHIVVEQDSGESHQAQLAVGWLSDNLTHPGAEWLYRYLQTPGHIEASVRFRIVPPDEVARHAQKKLAAIHDQVSHIGQTSAEVPIAVSEALGTARALEHAVTKDQAPLAYWHARFTVSATSEADLEETVSRLVSSYRNLGLELQRPRGSQLTLMFESVPGGAAASGSYEQVTGVQTLGGSMFQATVSLGDGIGPYIGYTLGAGHTAGVRVPVHYDPLRAAQQLRDGPGGERPTGETVVAITGTLGGGKTNLAELLVYQAVQRGASGVVVDPKGDNLGLLAVPGLVNSREISLGPQHQGLLDPFSLGEDPADGALIAADTCQSLLGLGRERSDRRDLNAVVRACTAEADSPNPSLAGVVRRLLKEKDLDLAAAGETLESIANLPLGRLCLAPGRDAVAPVRFEAGTLTVIGVAGLSLPPPEKAVEDYQLSERLSITVMYLTAQMLRRMVEGTKRSLPKILMFDEAWALTSASAGSALIERLSRTGRSKNAATLLVSQNVRDLTDQRVTNCISAMFGFRAKADDAVKDTLRLLHLEPTDAHMKTIRGLATGQCVFADVAGRCNVMAVDLVYTELREAFNTSPEAATAKARTTV